MMEGNVTMSSGQRGVSVFAGAMLSSLVFVASFIVATDTAQGYNGLPNSLSNYHWVGTMDADLALQGNNTLEPGYTTENGTAEYSNIKPFGSILGGADGLQTSDLNVAYTYKNYACNPVRLNATSTLTWDGPWGRFDPVPTFSLRSTPNGFLFTPFDFYGLSMVTKWETSCIYEEPGYTETGKGYVQWFPSDPYGEEGTKPSLLRQDTDPDPYHLVGSTTWTVDDPPDATVFDESMVAWVYTINYNLRLVANPRAKIGKVAVTGPAAVKKGKAATYRVKISNSGNATATGVRLKVKGRGVSFKASVGKISAGETEAIKAKLRPKKPGKIKAAFKVTSSNAGGKTARKTVTVRK